MVIANKGVTVARNNYVIPAVAVQQKLMRHSDIRTTMNIYGDVVTDEMAKSHSKVVGLALSRSA